jgi:hypothetical protein
MNMHKNVNSADLNLEVLLHTEDCRQAFKLHSVKWD